MSPLLACFGSFERAFGSVLATMLAHLASLRHPKRSPSGRAIGFWTTTDLTFACFVFHVCRSILAHAAWALGSERLAIFLIPSLSTRQCRLPLPRCLTGFQLTTSYLLWGHQHVCLPCFLQEGSKGSKSRRGPELDRKLACTGPKAHASGKKVGSGS